jgi:hypothetical protein
MKNKFVNARVTADEFRALALIASHEGLNQSESIRWLIREDAKRRGINVGLAQFFITLPSPIPEEVPCEHAG